MVAHLLQLLVINEAAMNNISTHLLGQDFGGDYPIVQYADDMSHPVLQSHIAQFFRGAGSHTHSTLVTFLSSLRVKGSNWENAFHLSRAPSIPLAPPDHKSKNLCPFDKDGEAAHGHF